MEQAKELDFKERIKKMIQDDIDLDDSSGKSKEFKSDMKEMEKEQPEIEKGSKKKLKIEVEADTKDELIKATMEAIKKLEE